MALMLLGQNLVALVNIKIAGKLVFTPLTLIIRGFDTHPYFVMAGYNIQPTYSKGVEHD